MATATYTPKLSPLPRGLPISDRHKVCLDPTYLDHDNLDQIRRTAQALFAEMDSRPDPGSVPAVIEYYPRFYQALGKGFWWYQ